MIENGDKLWFKGYTRSDGTVMPEQMAECVGLRFGGYIIAKLASGREVSLPEHMFKKLSVGELKPV